MVQMVSLATRAMQIIVKAVFGRSKWRVLLPADLPLLRVQRSGGSCGGGVHHTGVGVLGWGCEVEGSEARAQGSALTLAEANPIY